MDIQNTLIQQLSYWWYVSSKWSFCGYIVLGIWSLVWIFCSKKVSSLRREGDICLSHLPCLLMVKLWKLARLGNGSIASNYSNLPRKSIIYGSYFAFAILSFPHLPKCMPKQEFFFSILDDRTYLLLYFLQFPSFLEKFLINT